MNDQLNHIYDSTLWLLPELILVSALLITIVLGLILKSNKYYILKIITAIAFVTALLLTLRHQPEQSTRLFEGMLLLDSFSVYFKVLFLIGGIAGVWISFQQKENTSEYFMLLQSIVLGCCFLAMSTHFILVVISLELISLSSYMLAGFGFDKKSAEGSLKYFLFGSVATACTIYGLSIIYGLSGTLDFTNENFVVTLIQNSSPLLLIGSMLALAGVLFKIVAAPFHLWAPDVYESAPTPVVAFISVVPKLAGLALLARFTIAINLFGNSGYNWQIILAIISMVSILVGNLSALSQVNPKRMLAYSSVAQAGFLLVGIVPLGIEGIRVMMFYSAIFMIMNFLAFHTLSQFEKSAGTDKIPSFAGYGRLALLPALTMLMGFVSLTGLPPTAGFSAKLLIFSSLWGAYEHGGNIILVALLVVGLINTVVSLFFYLKIPYYLFLKEANHPIETKKFTLSGNLLNLILVFLLIYFFIHPDGLMGWINKINFVL